ncbi:MAG: T9SS type A sorting domain-containing protein [Bacteroidia bacterium]|nr:T9SS type A sorting domain-containing protein [Bacteroidia bacterium]
MTIFTKTKKTVFAIAILLLANYSFSQIKLTYSGSYSVSGTPGAVGTIYTWGNVGTQNGVTIKSKIEIISKTGGAVLETMDNSNDGSSRAWQPIINGSQNNGGCWGIEFKISFYNASNNNALTLSSFRSSGIDIDGDGDKIREYNRFDDPTNYTLESNTKLSVNSSNGQYTFNSPQSVIDGIDITQTRYIVSCYYENKQYITVKLGGCCVGGSCQTIGGNRLHSVNFYDVICFTDAKVLPVTLLYFKANKTNSKSVSMKWATTAEINNDFFSIERSTNGKDWTVISTIKGAGNSSQIINYSYTDNNPLNGTSYYRLKQTDYNGEYEYFQSRAVIMDARGKLNLDIFPNPAKENTTIKLTTLSESKAVVKLINTNGQIVINETELSGNSIQIETTTLPKGLYIVEIKQDENIIRKKLIIE